MYKLIIKEEAQIEIEEAIFYYEEKQFGLGDIFSKYVALYLEEIQKNPNHYQIKQKNYREAFIRKFPYVIIFEIIDLEVIVYAVFHTLLNPTKKP